MAIFFLLVILPMIVMVLGFIGLVVAGVWLDVQDWLSSTRNKIVAVGAVGSVGGMVVALNLSEPGPLSVMFPLVCAMLSWFVSDGKPRKAS